MSFTSCYCVTNLSLLSRNAGVLVFTLSASRLILCWIHSICVVLLECTDWMVKSLICVCSDGLKLRKCRGKWTALSIYDLSLIPCGINFRLLVTVVHTSNKSSFCVSDNFFTLSV